MYDVSSWTCNWNQWYHKKHRFCFLLSIGRDVQCHTIPDKLDDFDYHITNFQFLSGNILYFIFLNLRDTSECLPHFRLMARRLSSKRPKILYPVERLKLSFSNSYGQYENLLQQYEALSQM